MAQERLHKEENLVKISDIRIRFVKKETGKLKAVASMTIDDCFVVHDIKIIEGTDGPFIAMPSRKTNDGDFKDIAHPLNNETREMLKKVILSAYSEEAERAARSADAQPAEAQAAEAPAPEGAESAGETESPAEAEGTENAE